MNQGSIHIIFLEELEWTDYFEEETGIIWYYGDNREPEKEIRDTGKRY